MANFESLVGQLVPLKKAPNTLVLVVHQTIWIDKYLVRFEDGTERYRYVSELDTTKAKPYVKSR